MSFRSQSFIPNLMFWTLTESCNFWSSISFKTESKLARYTSHFLRARSSWCASFWILLSCSSCRHMQCSFTPFKTNEKRKKGWGGGGTKSHTMSIIIIQHNINLNISYTRNSIFHTECQLGRFESCSSSCYATSTELQGLWMNLSNFFNPYVKATLYMSNVPNSILHCI